MLTCSLLGEGRGWAGPTGADSVLQEAETLLLPTRGLPRSRRGFHGCCFQFSHSGCGQELGIEFQHTFGAQVCGDPGDWSKVPRRDSGMQLLGGQGAWGC